MKSKLNVCLLVVSLMLVASETMAQTKRPVKKRPPTTTPTSGYSSGYGAPATQDTSKGSGSGYTSGYGTAPTTTTTSTQVPDTLPIKVVKSSGSGFGDSAKVSMRPDGAITDASLIKDKTPLIYEHLREDDAVYKHRVWRIIDTREKMNLPFGFSADDDNGNQRVIAILLTAIKEKKVMAFDPAVDDRFTTPLDWEKIQTKLAGVPDTVPVFDLQGNPIAKEVRQKFVELDSINKFQLKEEWVFDKESSRMFVRIIGIAPMMKIKTSGAGITLGDEEYPMFWVYYPDMRPIFAKHEVYNPKNMGGRMSWEEIFESRFFSSYIVKSTQDNPFDRSFKDYLKDPLFRLLEGENVKEKIFNYEQNLWSY
jgi:gliding motility associated protien GldN